MKRMSFARRNALLPRGARALPAALILIIVLVFLIRIFAPNFFITLVTPLWRLSSFTTGIANNASAAIQNPATLSRELDAERAKNATLANENETMSGQLRALQNLLGTRTAPTKGVIAAVLARPPESPYDTLVIDEGEASGIVAGALVTGDAGAPLGRVASVAVDSARVALFSASGIKTDAWVGTGRVPITLSGIGGGSFEATAPKDAKIVAGDAVFVLGALSIGTVVRVDSDASSPTAALRIQSAINPFTLMFVVVAKNI